MINQRNLVNRKKEAKEFKRLQELLQKESDTSYRHPWRVYGMPRVQTVNIEYDRYIWQHKLTGSATDANGWQGYINLATINDPFNDIATRTSTSTNNVEELAGLRPYLESYTKYVVSDVQLAWQLVHPHAIADEYQTYDHTEALFCLADEGTGAGFAFPAMADDNFQIMKSAGMECSVLKYSHGYDSGYVKSGRWASFGVHLPTLMSSGVVSNGLVGDITSGVAADPSKVINANFILYDIRGDKTNAATQLDDFYRVFRIKMTQKVTFFDPIDRDG